MSGHGEDADPGQPSLHVGLAGPRAVEAREPEPREESPGERANGGRLGSSQPGSLQEQVVERLRQQPGQLPIHDGLLVDALPQQPLDREAQLLLQVLQGAPLSVGSRSPPGQVQAPRVRDCTVKGAESQDPRGEDDQGQETDTAQAPKSPSAPRKDLTESQEKHRSTAPAEGAARNQTGKAPEKRREGCMHLQPPSIRQRTQGNEETRAQGDQHGDEDGSHAATLAACVDPDLLTSRAPRFPLGDRDSLGQDPTCRHGAVGESLPGTNRPPRPWGSRGSEWRPAGLRGAGDRWGAPFWRSAAPPGAAEGLPARRSTEVSSPQRRHPHNPSASP